MKIITKFLVAIAFPPLQKKLPLSATGKGLITAETQDSLISVLQLVEIRRDVILP